nr:DUF6366 family protein [Sporosarcina cyprini]
MELNENKKNLVQKEREGNPVGNVKDSLDQGSRGLREMSWKATGVLIIGAILVYIVIVLLR